MGRKFKNAYALDKFPVAGSGSVIYPLKGYEFATPARRRIMGCLNLHTLYMLSVIYF